MLVLLAVPLVTAAASNPTDRPTDPTFAPIDEAILGIMEDRGIHAATFAMSQDGSMVWSQGYGTMQPNGGGVVPADAMLRIASLSKPITLAAIWELDATGELSKDDVVFCIPADPDPSCHLPVDPLPGSSVDPRLGDITIDHVLNHEGGWDRYISTPTHPMFRAHYIADAVGVDSPPSQEDIIRYMVSQPLDHKPGTQWAYSNFGYMLLGRILEDVTGEDYVDWVKANLFQPWPTEATEDPVPKDVEMGHSLERNPREPSYKCEGGWMTTSAFPPYDHVCWPDGAWDLEAIGAAGGLIASAPTYLWFIDHYHMWSTPTDYGPVLHNNNGMPRAQAALPSPVPTSLDVWTGYHFGSLDGTFTIAQQRLDGVTWVALFNQRWDPDHGWDYEPLREIIDDAVDEVVAQAP